MFRVLKLRRKATWAVIAVLLMAAVAPALGSGRVSAYNLVTAREIKMSSSLASATNTTYRVQFTAGTTATIKGIIVDFCDTTPIIGDTCTKPSGFTVGTPTVANQTTISGYTASSANSGRTLRLVDSTGTALTATSSTVSFELTTATNPSATNATFYARILTFPNDSGADSPLTYTDTAPGNATDAGGIALSTANQLTITSKVQERLSFCVYTGVNCAAGGSAITLGDTHGVLDPAGVYIDKNGKYDVSTNASGNVAIRVKGDTLTSGSNTITAVGGTAAVSNPGSEQFGFCTYQATGSGLTASSPYDGSGGTGPCSGSTQSAGTGTPGGDNGAKYAFDTASTNTTYGQTFASKVPGATSQGLLVFLGNISNSTEAGIYTTTLTFIATGTF